ncbi:FAD/NAD-P-binding domain-containing protein [Mycena rebaudengoi]|nr:FAD/NAD-P-binding domain-containing protein [Mycena rebaudengoi]
MAGPEQVKHICIIGAGPGGLAALKCILDTPPSFRTLIQCPASPDAAVRLANDEPLPTPSCASRAYPSRPPPPVFQPASHVQKYLESYAAHFGLRPFIRLKHSHQRRAPRFLASRATPPSPGSTHGSRPGRRSTRSGIAARRRTKTVLVVGGGPSGGDISMELHPLCRSLILRHQRRPRRHNTHGRTTHFGDPDRGGALRRRVRRARGGLLRAGDGVPGRRAFPPRRALQSGLPPRAPPLPDVLRNSTHHLFPLAEHVFPVPAGWGAELTTSLAPRQSRIAHPDALDVDAARSGVLARYAALGGDADPAGVARAWSLFGGEEQFEHTDRMHALAGRPEVRVPQWRRDMYEHKVVLQSFWEELERRGEARKWVAGVGEGGGFGEWVDLLQRLLEAAREWTATEA